MRKENSLLVFGLLSMIFLIGLVSCANTPNITNPYQDKRVNGSYGMRVVLDTNTLAFANATFYYDDGSSNTSICSNVSGGYTATEFNCSWTTTSLVDTNDYTIWVIMNNTNGVGTQNDSSTGVDGDQGNPTCTTTAFTDNLHLLRKTNFTTTISADTSRGIINCSYYYAIKDGAVIQRTTIAGSGNACTNTTNPIAVGMNANEVYSVIVQAVDRNSDKTNCTALTMRVTPEAGGGGGGGSYDAPQQPTGESPGVVKSIGSFFSNIFKTISNFFKNLF